MENDNAIKSEDAPSENTVMEEKDKVNGGAIKKEVESSNESAMDESQNSDDAEEKETELTKYWKTVEENPMDFTGWTYLLQFVEQEAKPDDCRKAYEAFFSHYPYCYGYWKKYSDMEKKHGNSERAVEVFEKGLRAIPLSVELWLHYINFYIAEYGTADHKVEIKRLYERALAAAGMEFRSDKLWDSFISWENGNGNLKTVTNIYEKLIRTPTQLYSHHWDNFCRHINTHHPKEILDTDTFLKARSEILHKGGPGHVIEEVDDVGLDEALGMTDHEVDAPPGMVNSFMGDEREIKKIRAKLIETREVVFKANEAEVGKRWTFEETIRRPYFHVKPLERGQLKNWREYLDFEISQNNHSRIVVLFERSLIACALYEDFWMKYAKYLEQHVVDGVRNVYQRACDIHLPKKPYIHVAWAAFEERRESYALARKILLNIERNVPGLAMVCMRRISLERRCKNHQAVEELFKKYIEKAVSHKTRTFFSIKYARYLQKVMNETEKARKVLTDVLDIDNTNEKVIIQLLDVEYQSQPIDETRLMDTLDRLLKSDVSLEFKVRISQRRMEFLEDFGTCIQKISNAYDEHQKLVKEASSKKKRPVEQVLEEPPDKKPKVDVVVPLSAGEAAPPPPPLGPPPPDMSYPPSYNQWPNTGYAPMPNPYASYSYPSYSSQYSSQYGYYGY